MPEDYQRIVVDFGNSVAFPSDQGLFIKPWGEDKDLTLVNASGNMSNNIAITLAISEGYEGENYMVMTVWDWNVIGYVRTKSSCTVHCFFQVKRTLHVFL